MGEETQGRKESVMHGTIASTLECASCLLPDVVCVWSLERSEFSLIDSVMQLATAAGHCLATGIKLVTLHMCKKVQLFVCRG